MSTRVSVGDSCIVISSDPSEAGTEGGDVLMLTGEGDEHTMQRGRCDSGWRAGGEDRSACFEGPFPVREYCSSEHDEEA